MVLTFLYDEIFAGNYSSRFYPAELIILALLTGILFFNVAISSPNIQTPHCSQFIEEQVEVNNTTTQSAAEWTCKTATTEQIGLMWLFASLGVLTWLYAIVVLLEAITSPGMLQPGKEGNE